MFDSIGGGMQPMQTMQPLAPGPVAYQEVPSWQADEWATNRSVDMARRLAMRQQNVAGQQSLVNKTAGGLGNLAGKAAWKYGATTLSPSAAKSAGAVVGQSGSTLASGLTSGGPAAAATPATGASLAAGGVSSTIAGPTAATLAADAAPSAGSSIGAFAGPALAAAGAGYGVYQENRNLSQFNHDIRDWRNSGMTPEQEARARENQFRQGMAKAAAGAGVGAASGAAAGSVVPVIGTGIGAVVGGVAGAIPGLYQAFRTQDGREGAWRSSVSLAKNPFHL